MTDDVRHFQPSIPAGTPSTALAVVSIAVPVANVDRIDWKVPPGHGGLVGWFLAMGNVQVRPLPIGTFVVCDNKDGSWPGGGLPDSGAWQLIGYNTGKFAHAVWLTFHLTFTRPRPRPVVLLPAQLLAPVPDWRDVAPFTGIV